MNGPTRPDDRSADAKVLRAFVRDGRLVAIPARQSKRLAVLRYLLETCFPDDRPYGEPEVNERLGRFHPDVAALRRYLVEAGLMTRAHGVYRRSGSVLPTSSGHVPRTAE